MTDTPRPFERARNERARGNNFEAGEFYTCAGYRKSGIVPLDSSGGGELKHFLEAATSYRIGGETARSINRCKTGILRAADLHERAMDRPEPEHDLHIAIRGCWKEAIAIFRLVGGLSGVDEAYDEAFEIYEAGGDPRSDRAEPPKTPIYTWFQALETAATNQSLGVEFQRTKTFTEYGRYMRERIPEYLKIVEDEGTWEP